MPRLRTSCSTVDDAIGADDVYQICGFGRADSVGNSAPIIGFVRANASSR
jgi:hypothetical protein